MQIDTTKKNFKQGLIAFYSSYPKIIIGIFYAIKTCQAGKNIFDYNIRGVDFAFMFTELMNYKKSLEKKIMPVDKADPGSLSFMEPGWWVFHAVAITGIYMIAQHNAKNSFQNDEYKH